MCVYACACSFFFSSRRRHTRCALVTGVQTCALPILLDDPALAMPGASFGSLFLVPGIGETLRINGHVAAVADGAARIAVAESYVHCAKALISSGFWPDGPSGAAPATTGSVTRESGGEGKSVSVRVDLVCRRHSNKKKKKDR